MYIAAKMALAWTQVNNCTDEFIYVWISVLSNYCLNANSEQHVWIFLQKSKVIHVLPTHWLSFGNWMKQCEHHQQFLKFWHILILTKCYQKQIIFYISIDWWHHNLHQNLVEFFPYLFFLWHSVCKISVGMDHIFSLSCALQTLTENPSSPNTLLTLTVMI